MTKNKQLIEYGVYVGAKVFLDKDDRWVGIDENLNDITTCNVCWIKQADKYFPDSENRNEWDIQWTNKIIMI